MKKVTIVLPVFNGEARIQKAIESIIAQTYSNLEIIIVNDCSTDRTGEILDSFAIKDKRIRIINNKVNQKLPQSLNIGFSFSSGDYLTWTSDDNCYHKDAIEKMVNYLEKNSDVDFVYTDFSIVNMDGSLREELHKDEPDKIRFFNPVGACFLYRRELADRIGIYDKEMFLAEDYEYWIKAYLNGKINHLSENLYDYGWHENSLTSKRSSEIRHQTFLAKNKHFNELYSRCETDEEKVTFLFEMLNLLDNPKEYKKKRKEYSKICAIFASEEKKRRRERFVEKISNYLKNSSWLVISIGIILPFLASILLSVPAADDFREAFTVRGKNILIASIKGASNTWLTWGGHWPAQFIEKYFNPLVWFDSYRSVGVMLAISYILFVIIVFFLIKKIFCEYFELREKNTFHIIFVFTLLLIMNTGIYPEIYYWFVGNCYLWELDFALINVIFLIKFFRKMNCLNGVLLSVIGFVACFGYMYALSLGLFYLFVYLNTRKLERKNRLLSLIPLCFMILGGCLSAFAPGNFVRHAYIEEGIHFKRAVLRTIPSLMDSYLGLFSNVIFICCILLLFFVGMTISNNSIKNISLPPVLLVAAQIVGPFGAMFCVALGYGSIYELPNRIHFIINSVIALWSAFTSFYLGIYVSCRIDNKIVASSVKYAISVFGIILLFNSVIVNNNMILSIPWVKTTRLFEAEFDESKYYISLLENVRNSSDNNVILEYDLSQVPSETGIINPIGLSDDSSYWVNEGLAKWFEKDSIEYIVRGN